MATENPTTNTWAQRALSGLIEAQLAGESISALVDQLLQTCEGEQFPLLHAIKACAMRIDAGVDKAIDEGQSLCRTEVAHG